MAAFSIILSVASTLFLLLLSDQIGYGITTSTSQILTSGISNVFSRYIIFIEALVFVVGGVIVLFVILLSMDQKKKDFGLIKAIGCRNTLVLTYFVVELLILSFVSCVIGIVLGFLSNYIFVNFSGFPVIEKSINLWFGLLVFGTYFFLSIVFGARPLIKSANLSPVEVMSPVKYFGLIKTDVFKPISRFGVTLRIALRSLYRRQDSVLRVVFFMSVIFFLLSVSVSGGLIASDTTNSWINEVVSDNTIIVGKSSVCDHYEFLLSKFSNSNFFVEFDYLDPSFHIPDMTIPVLRSAIGVLDVDPRLLVIGHIEERSTFTIDTETQATISVGENREIDALIVGIESDEIVDVGYVEGRFLEPADSWHAVIGDSISQEVFSKALIQSLKFYNRSFSIVGVQIDPINNGRVVYVPSSTLQNISGFVGFNMITAKLDSSQNREESIEFIEKLVKEVDDDLVVRDLKNVIEANTDYLSSVWSSLTIVSLFSLIPATLCLLSYWFLFIEDQKKEFGIFRAIGVRPRIIVFISSIQDVIVLVSSWAAGTSLGISASLLILIPDPFVTIFTVLTVLLVLILIPLTIFFISLIPARRLCKKPVIELLR